MDYYRTKIVEVEAPAKGYAKLRFKGDVAIKGNPGQFVMVRGSWGKHPVLPRAFSLVESGDHGAILVREIGEGTQALVSMKPGDDLFVLGPLGNGYGHEKPKEKAILVAGGVGVAPLVFMAERLVQQGVKPVFLYGARTGEDLPLADQIDSLCDLVVTTEDGSIGEKGLITAPLRRILETDPVGKVFSCGPEPMLRAVAKECQRVGADCEVALESPMACGMGTCKGCAVIFADGSFRYVCSDGPVFRSTKIFGGDK